MLHVWSPSRFKFGVKKKPLSLNCIISKGVVLTMFYTINSSSVLFTKWVFSKTNLAYTTKWLYTKWCYRQIEYTSKIISLFQRKRQKLWRCCVRGVEALPYPKLNVPENLNSAPLQNCAYTIIFVKILQIKMNAIQAVYHKVTQKYRSLTVQKLTQVSYANCKQLLKTHFHFPGAVCVNVTSGNADMVLTAKIMSASNFLPSLALK